MSRRAEATAQERKDIMKTSIRNVLVTAVLMGGANGLMASQASNSWIDQWYRAKFGRGSPTEEARLRAEQANTAYREEATAKAAVRNTWFEDFWRAKFGRGSPMEEARLRAEQANTAYREEATAKAPLPNTWLDDFWKAKYGRSFPGK
jgi:hypothetical protein